MQTTFKDRLLAFLDYLEIGQTKFEENTGLGRASISKIKDGMSSPNLAKIARGYPKLNIDWLITGSGEMLKDEKTPDLKTNFNKANIEEIETRPRIPLNAAAGSVSVALSGITAEDAESLPFIHAFSNYSYTILVKGDSMEPEFHSGDELACLQLNGNANFIQWGRYHVLDTAQGIVVKRIYESEDYILCKSENNDLYPDFKIHKEEIYNIGLVIGMLRRY